MDISANLVSRPSSGPSTPQSRTFDTSLTEWRMGHLIQLLEEIRDTGALPKWKTEYQLYLLAVRDSMIPNSPGSRSSSICSYDEDEIAPETPETASTANTIESDIEDIEISHPRSERKRSIASDGPEDHLNNINEEPDSKKQCLADGRIHESLVIRRSSKGFGMLLSPEHNTVADVCNLECSCSDLSPLPTLQTPVLNVL